MCGRFTQQLSWAELHRLADLIGQPRNLAPRYNISPTTSIEVIRVASNSSELVPMRWGLVPYWWKKSLKEVPSTFNARSERVADGPMWRGAFKSRRCIIPASGFYEWTGPKAARIPHYFSTPDGQPLAFAGFWDNWRSPEGEDILSATIIVGPANEWMSAYHDRQPVMLDWRDAAAWMRGDNPASLLRQPPEDSLREWVVSTRVNRSGVGDDDPNLIEAA